MVVKKRSGGWSKVLDGVEMQNLAYGERTHMVKFLLHAGSRVPQHNHQQEQTGFLIQGRVLMNIDGTEYQLEEGDSWAIGGGVTHGVEVQEECVAIEIFSPLRKDYLNMES